MSYKVCCVPNCNVKDGKGIPLHCFPSPVNDYDRFKQWVSKCGATFEGKDDLYIFTNRRICHKHFTSNYFYPKNRLCKLSVPMLNLPESAPQESESIFNNQNSNDSSSSFQMEIEKCSNICRICATAADDTCPIFDEESQEDDLLMKINKHLPIKISKEDGLPHIICYQCRSTILAWDELVKCCIQADTTLQQKGQVLDPDKIPKDEIGEPTETTVQLEWTPRRVSIESSPSERGDRGDDFKYATESDPYLRSTCKYNSDEDDRPLSAIASKTKSNLYQNFYTALVNFRNHLVTEHDNPDCDSEFSDSSDSETVNERDSQQMDLNSFDDLTDTNMRKDKMDEGTRTELSQVQTRINGKVYYTCKICGKHLSSTHTYIFHKRIHTGERPCVCHICGKQFRAPNGLQRHVTETHEKQRWYTCIVCLKNFANSQNLKQHMRIHTGERPFVCSHCGKRFTQSGSLHVHLKTHSEHFPHHCTECGAKFRLRSGLTRHRLKHTGERPHVCVHCGKGFRQKHELNTHVLAHTDSKPHACTICGTAFRQRRALRHHCKRLHQNEPNDVTHVVYDHIAQYEGYREFGCVKIERVEILQRDNIHQQMENIETPINVVMNDKKKYCVCDICKKSVSIASWKRHSRSHDTVKRYSCHTCGLGFNDSGNLSRHRRALHAALRPHACHICHKSFSRNSHLEDHIKSHSENRDYVCDMCGKASKSSAALRMHKKIHEDDYRFGCIYCESKFKRRGQLLAHVSVHTGEKAHACGCGKAFRLKSQLTSHSRTHNRNKGISNREM